MYSSARKEGTKCIQVRVRKCNSKLDQSFNRRPKIVELNKLNARNKRFDDDVVVFFNITNCPKVRACFPPFLNHTSFLSSWFAQSTSLPAIYFTLPSYNCTNLLLEYLLPLLFADVLTHDLCCTPTLHWLNLFTNWGNISLLQTKLAKKYQIFKWNYESGQEGFIIIISIIDKNMILNATLRNIF